MLNVLAAIGIGIVVGFAGLVVVVVGNRVLDYLE